MGHALQEAARILKPDGLLFDLRPAIEHRRVWVEGRESRQLVGVMREIFADDRAADRAVAESIGQSLFGFETCLTVELDRVMDTPEDFDAWIGDLIERGKLPPHDWLIKRLKQAQQKQGAGMKIVVRGPLLVRRLTKLS